MGKKKKIKIKDINKLIPNIQVQCGCTSTSNYDSNFSEYSVSVDSKKIIANIYPNGFPDSSILSVKTKHHFVPISYNTPSSFKTSEGTFLVVTGTGTATDTKTGGYTSGVFSLILQKNHSRKKDLVVFTYSGINPIGGKNLSISISDTLAKAKLTISPNINTNRNVNMSESSDSQILTQVANMINPSLQAISNSLEKMASMKPEPSPWSKHQSNEIVDHTIVGMPSAEKIDVSSPMQAYEDASSNDITVDETDKELIEDVPIEDTVNVAPVDESIVDDDTTDDSVMDAPTEEPVNVSSHEESDSDGTDDDSDVPVAEPLDVTPTDDSNSDSTDDDSGADTPVVEPVDAAPTDESDSAGTDDDSGADTPVAEPLDVTPTDEANSAGTDDDSGADTPVVDPVDATPTDESDSDGTDDDSGADTPVVEPVDAAPTDESDSDGTKDDSGADTPAEDPMEDLSDNEIVEDLTVSNTTETLPDPDLQLVEGVPGDDTKEDVPVITPQENIEAIEDNDDTTANENGGLTLDDQKD